MAGSIINVENLRVLYNQGKSNEVRSLDGVGVEIYPEEYIIIYGPSGCGKSTLLYAIAGLQMPTYGEVTIEDKKISAMNKKELVILHQKEIGMVFQAFYLIPTLNVLDNVCLPKTFTGDNIKNRREAGMTLLRRFGIAEQADKFPSQLSGGQKQRVAIARSLINNPDIILADEPVGNLDTESAQNVLDILKELNTVDKKTVIMVTHNAEHLHYANRVVHMKDGKIVEVEVQKEMRPPEAIKKEEVFADGLPSELKMLMRSFKNLTPQQLGVMLVPFKAKQLLMHVLAELTEEQMKSAENYLKEYLFHNIDTEALFKDLDLDFAAGGAGWNRQRAHSFSGRVEKIVNIAEVVRKDAFTGLTVLIDYFADLFKINFEPEPKFRFKAFLKLRLENKIDRSEFQRRLDMPKALGGVGLYKNTAEKLTNELEVIMLLKYSA